METEILQEVKKDIIRSNSTLIAKTNPKGDYSKKRIVGKGWEHMKAQEQCKYKVPHDFDTFFLRNHFKKVDYFFYNGICKVLSRVDSGLRITHFNGFIPYIANVNGAVPLKMKNTK